MNAQDVFEHLDNANNEIPDLDRQLVSERSYIYAAVLSHLMRTFELDEVNAEFLLRDWVHFEKASPKED